MRRIAIVLAVWAGLAAAAVLGLIGGRAIGAHGVPAEVAKLFGQHGWVIAGEVTARPGSIAGLQGPPWSWYLSLSKAAGLDFSTYAGHDGLIGAWLCAPETTPGEVAPGEFRCFTLDGLPADRTPVEPAPVKSLPLVEIYPAVPLHPTTTKHDCASEERCFAQIEGGTAADVLDWYITTLEAGGWKREPLSLPSTAVLLFSRNGEYLSISGRQTGPNTVVWFHRRETPQVTQAEAVQITSATHRSEAEMKWVPSFVPDFDSERYGAGTRHPVWVVEAKSTHSSVTVWVDAVTAEPFRIRQSDDF